MFVSNGGACAVVLWLQTPRVVTAGAALLQKVNIYECLATLQQTVDRLACVLQARWLLETLHSVISNKLML